MKELDVSGRVTLESVIQPLYSNYVQEENRILYPFESLVFCQSFLYILGLINKNIPFRGLPPCHGVFFISQGFVYSLYPMSNAIWIYKLLVEPSMVVRSS